MCMEGQHESKRECDRGGERERERMRVKTKPVCVRKKVQNDLSRKVREKGRVSEKSAKIKSLATVLSELIVFFF